MSGVGVEQPRRPFADTESGRFGAAGIAEQAAYAIRRRAATGAPASPDAFRHEISLMGWRSIRAQPAMAPLVNLMNMVLWAMEDADTPERLRGAIGSATDSFIRQLDQNTDRVSQHARRLIADGTTIVTISFSTTVQRALLDAQRVGRRFTVICGESQPTFEGRQTAELLASSGIAVRLVDDDAALAAVTSANFAVVGADTLGLHGLTNRLGTRPLAEAAHAAGVPFYAFCGSEKFLPAGFPYGARAAPPHEQLPTELVSTKRYFDTTPLSLLAGIVTEQGVLPVEGIEAWLAATRLHPSLANPEHAEF